MKKKLLMGLVGLSLLFPISEINAETLDSVTEGENSTSENITVGEVETPVYNVEITWTDLTFDWKYDTTEEKYQWFSSSNFNIQDKTTGGRIHPEIEWKSAENYEWTIGKFSYHANGDVCTLISTEESFNNLINQNEELYLDSNCKNKDMSDEKVWEEEKWYFPYPGTYLELETKQIPDTARIYVENNETGEKYYNYSVILSLEIDDTKEMLTPKTGDTIGSVTITINKN